MIHFDMDEYSMNVLLCVIGLILNIIVWRAEFESGLVFERKMITKSRLVLWMTINSMVITATEIVYSLLVTVSGTRWYLLKNFNQIVNILALATLAYLWLIYCMVRAGFRIKRKCKLCALLAVPFLAVVLFTITTPITHLVFYYDKLTGMYYEGPLLIIPWIVDPVYIFIGTIIALTYRKKALRFFPVFIMVGAVFVGACLQKLTGGMCTIGVSISIALVELSMNNKSELAYTDSLTGLYNRYYGQTHLASLLRRVNLEGQSLIGIEFDLDRFKEINDKYGHGMGDLALQTFAGVLRTFESSLVIRTGGDEFIMLFLGRDISEAQVIIQKVRSQVEEINRSGKHPFIIMFSAGAAIYDDSMESIEMLTAAMDTEMYRMKTTHHG